MKIKNLFFTIAFVLFTSEIFAQPYISAQIQKEEKEGKIYLLVKGDAELTDRSVLNISLSFADYTIPDSEKKALVWGKKFQMIYPLSSIPLSGNYTLITRYIKSEQIIKTALETSDFERYFTFYIGDPEQEREQRQDYRAFLQSFPRLLNNLFEDMKKQCEVYQKTPDKVQKKDVTDWLHQWEISFQSLKDEFKKRSFASVLVPYSPKTFRDLEETLILLENLYVIRKEDLSKQFDFPFVSKRVGVENPLFAPKASDYEEEIKRRLKSISIDEQFVENIRSIETDLLITNQLYGQLIKEYELEKGDYQEARWKAWIKHWTTDLSIIEDRIKSYPKGEISSRNAQLRSDFDRLLGLLNKLSGLYDKKLQVETTRLNKEEKAIEVLIDEIIQIGLKISKSILSEKKFKDQKQKEIQRKIQQDQTILLNLLKDMEDTGERIKKEGGGIEKWQKWDKEWHSRLQELEDNIKGYANTPYFSTFFPEVERYMKVATSCLTWMNLQYKQELEGKSAPYTEQRVKYFRWVLSKMLSKLETDLEIKKEE